MSEIKHAKIEDLKSKHVSIHEDFEYFKKKFVPREHDGKTMVSIYEIPPLKSAYPYHFHLKDEETFYILSGEGLLKSPNGEEPVRAGELLFFPAGSGGAHRLTNTSHSENLVYIDFDVVHDLDVAVYPDSNKIGIWGKDVNRVYRADDNVDYYTDE